VSRTIQFKKKVGGEILQ